MLENKAAEERGRERERDEELHRWRGTEWEKSEKTITKDTHANNALDDNRRKAFTKCVNAFLTQLYRENG